MAVHLIDLSPPDLDAIRELVQLGRFASVEDFLVVAIRNQLVLERASGANASPGSTPLAMASRKTELADDLVEAASPVPVLRRARLPKGADGQATWDMPGLESFELENLALTALPTLPTPALAAGPLFGQYYRFLPVKLVLRALAAESETGFLDLKILGQKATNAAKLLAEALEDLPLGATPLSLATGLPSEGRDANKSAARFEAQYVGRIRSTGQPDGFGFAVGFLAAKEESGRVRVGFTDAGLAFMKLRNNVLDDRETTPLTNEEARFLINWIKERLPDEFKHLRAVVGAIRQGASSPTSVGEAMMQFYGREFPAAPWTAPKANLTRSGAVSRLIEMQVVNATKEGQRVVYAVNGSLAEELGL